MSTSKIIITGTLLLVLSMLYVTAAQSQSENLLFSFASLSPDYTNIRIAIVILLFGLLLSSPPRSMLFRTIIGFASVGLVAMASYSFFAYSIRVIDAIVFLQVAIIFGIEALEPRDITADDMLPARRTQHAQ